MVERAEARLRVRPRGDDPPGLDYKIQLLFRLDVGGAAYTLDGRSFREFTVETMKFAAALEQAGILTAVPDDNALIAKCAGMDVRGFRDASRLWCTIGDAEAMAQMVSRANRTIVRR